MRRRAHTLGGWNLSATHLTCRGQQSDDGKTWSIVARSRRPFEFQHGLLGPALIRSAFAGPLLAVALACQRRLDALLLTRLQIERVPLDVLDDVFLQDLALEAPERAIERKVLQEDIIK